MLLFENDVGADVDGRRTVVLAPAPSLSHTCRKKADPEYLGAVPSADVYGCYQDDALSTDDMDSILRQRCCHHPFILLVRHQMSDADRAYDGDFEGSAQQPCAPPLLALPRPSLDCPSRRRQGGGKGFKKDHFVLTLEGVGCSVAKDVTEAKCLKGGSSLVQAGRFLTEAWPDSLKMNSKDSLLNVIRSATVCGYPDR
eukprot:3937058-Rhodomonas_salina.2